MEIKIGSLNCLNFGFNSIGKKDIKLIASIIINEKIDIIALQEVKSSYAVNFIVNELKLQSSINWKSYFDKSDPRPEYAFIWNGGKLDYPKTRQLNGEVRIFLPHIYNQYRRTFEFGRISLAHPPLYGRFQTIANGLPIIELRLINAHIRYSRGKDGEALQGTVSEGVLRNNELETLIKYIYYNVSDKEYGARDGEGSPRNSFTILLGDYNLNLSDSSAKSPYIRKFIESCSIGSKKTEKGEKQIDTVQCHLSTLKKPLENQEQHTNIFSNNYDHFSYDKNKFSEVSHSEILINTVEKYCNGDLNEYYKKVSDHVLIIMKLTY